MRTIVTLFTLLSLIFVSCEGRDAQSPVSVWDGTAAQLIEGSGTESDPYRITSANELAYIAKEVNSGNDFADDFFSLEVDIDLSGIDWTPIGDGANPFSGNFNGNGHTISDLSLTSVSKYYKEYSTGKYLQGVSGLFGYCKNTSICNLSVKYVELNVAADEQFNALYLGTVTGRLDTAGNCELSDISVSNVTIRLSTPSGTGTELYTGGVVGYLSVEETAECKISRIQTDISTEFSESNDSPYRIVNNYIGGVVGSLAGFGKAECEDIVCYLTENFPDNGKFSSGAFGHTQITSDGSSEINLRRIFSKVYVNRDNVTNGEFESLPANYESYAIVGKLLHGKAPDGTRSGGYKFERLYGCVQNTVDKSLLFELYSPESPALYSESFCKSCESLPSDNGFDQEIWDLSDLEHPGLK